MSLTNFMKDVSIFKDLTAVQMAKVESISNVRNCKKGEVIIKEGDAGTEFFTVIDGLIAINKNVAGGRRRNLVNLSAGETFGELVMFDQEPRSASAEAVKDSTIAVFQIDRFMEIMKRDVDLSNRVQIQIIKMMCERLRNTDNLLNEGVIWGFRMAI